MLWTSLYSAYNADNGISMTFIMHQVRRRDHFVALLKLNQCYISTYSVAKFEDNRFQGNNITRENCSPFIIEGRTAQEQTGLLRIFYHAVLSHTNR